MESKREQMKSHLMAQAEILFDELLEWHEETPAPDLRQIEDIVLQLRKRFGEQLAMEVMEAQEACRPVPGPHCPLCQGEMRYKDMKDKVVESRAGPLKVGRGYYYCPRCGEGLFPPRPTTSTT